MAGKQEIAKNRQYLLDTVIEQMESGTLKWKQGWDNGSVHTMPRSGSSGKAYKGINRLVLYFTAKERGYEDNRWVTFNYVKNNNLSFKKNENGESLAKGAGVMVEFFRYYDKSTKQDLDFEKFGELSPEEQHDYWKKNVRRVTQQYTVFNASLVEGMEPLPQAPVRTEIERDAEAERIVAAWDQKQCRIYNDDMMAYYSPKKDEIHLPASDTFISAAEYYATALHEIGHATGHKSRLNRDLKDGFGTEGYAIEELRAEFASMFIQQELGLPMSESHIKNHAAYVQSWLKAIRENPDVLFDAVGDADAMTSFVMDNAAGYEMAAGKNTVANTTPSPSDAMRAMLQGAPKSQMGTGGAVAQHANQNINE